jgi:putative PIN family toxin of toxin-antitoxin system
MSAPHHAVFDCNVFLQAMISARGPASECLRRVFGGEVLLYVSQTILKELRSLPNHAKLRKFRQLSQDKIEAFIVELLDVAVLADTPQTRFVYPRDPDDAHYVNLAIATGSMLVVSNDQDLLVLMTDGSPEGKALRSEYPSFQVLTPPQFLTVLVTKRE